MDDSNSHHGLIKNSELSSTDVDGPQSPQKIGTTLALPVESFSVLCPVQFIVNMYPQVLIILHNIHTDPPDGNRGHRCLGSPQIHYEFFSLCHILMQMILLTPCDKVVHTSLVLIFIALTDKSNYCRVIRKLLKMADF